MESHEVPVILSFFILNQTPGAVPAVSLVKIIFMKFQIFGLTLFSFLIFTACQKNEAPLVCEHETNLIRFDQPEVGQVSRYVRFSDTNANDDDNNFNFIKDTLVLEIVSADSGGFKVKESLTPGSNCLTQAENPCHSDAVFYYFKIENDTVLLYDPLEPEVCCPMIFWQSFKLPLTTANHVFTVDKWKLEAPASITTCPETGRVENFKQFGTDYGTMKVASTLSCNRAFDGHDYTYVYSESKGIVRYYEIGSWVPKAEGWYLLK